MLNQVDKYLASHQNDKNKKLGNLLKFKGLSGRFDPVGYLLGNGVGNLLGNLPDNLVGNEVSYLLDNGLGHIVGHLPGEPGG